VVGGCGGCNLLQQTEHFPQIIPPFRFSLSTAGVKKDQKFTGGQSH
jgi:hypothetical protein